MKLKGKQNFTNMYYKAVFKKSQISNLSFHFKKLGKEVHIKQKKGINKEWKHRTKDHRFFKKSMKKPSPVLWKKKSIKLTNLELSRQENKKTTNYKTRNQRTSLRTLRKLKGLWGRIWVFMCQQINWNEMDKSLDILSWNTTWLHKCTINIHKHPYEDEQ